MRSLPNYLNRIGLKHAPLKADLSTLALVMAAHSRAIAFENIDVVRGKTISMARGDVEKKLVDDLRGGYCWEQNTLLSMALEEIGFDVVPLLCRVRWNKVAAQRAPSRTPPGSDPEPESHRGPGREQADDKEEPNTTFTHFALKVSTDAGPHLADVGFAGTNSMAPVRLDGEDGAAQPLPEGLFRVVDGTHARYRQLQLQVKGGWRGLYEWRDERAPLVDQERSQSSYSSSGPRRSRVARGPASRRPCGARAGSAWHSLDLHLAAGVQQLVLVHLP